MKRVFEFSRIESPIAMVKGTAFGTSVREVLMAYHVNMYSPCETRKHMQGLIRVLAHLVPGAHHLSHPPKVKQIQPHARQLVPQKVPKYTRD